MEKYIKELWSGFQKNSNKQFWKEELQLANQDAEKNLFMDLCPWFYSGQLFNVQNGELTILPDARNKIFFLTENPFYSVEQDKFLDELAAMTFHEYINEANNKLSNWHRGNASTVYSKITQLTYKIWHPDALDLSNALGEDNNYYIYAHKNLILIDWFPFYSNGFRLRSQNSYGINSFHRVIQFIINCNIRLLIIGSASLRNMLTKEYDNFGLIQDINLENRIEEDVFNQDINDSDIQLLPFNCYSPIGRNELTILVTNSFADRKWGVKGIQPTYVRIHLLGSAINNVINNN